MVLLAKVQVKIDSIIPISQASKWKGYMAGYVLYPKLQRKKDRLEGIRW